MIKKTTYFSVSLLTALALNLSPALFAQEEEDAPKISISFGDEEEIAPTTKAAPAPAPATTAGPADAGAEKETPTKFTEIEELFAIYGWLMVRNNQVHLLEMSDREQLAFRTGVHASLRNRIIENWEERRLAVAELIDERWAPVQERMERERKEQTIEFFAELAKKENVKKTSTGLFYELISEGTGKFPPNGDSVVSAEYTAYLIDGTVIDSTANRGEGGPIPVILPNMVPGVREGLQYVREGGIIHLWVPASLGFSSDAENGIPPDSALMFEFTVHEILATEATPPADQP